MKNLLFSLSMTEKSLIEELWDYFVENYLENRVVYSNLGMEGSTMASVPLILAGITVWGVLIFSQSSQITPAVRPSTVSVGSTPSISFQSWDAGIASDSSVSPQAVQVTTLSPSSAQVLSFAVCHSEGE